MRIAILAVIMAILASPVVYGKDKAELVITSDRLEALRMGEITVFKGNVLVKKENATLEADSLESNKVDGYILAKGSVYAVDRSTVNEIVEVFCEEARYNEDISVGLLTGSPRVVRTDLEKEENNVEITGDIAEIFQEEKRGIVKGNAVVKQQDMRAESARLEYYSNLRRVVLTEGEPAVYQSNEDVDAKYMAGSITMFVDEQKIIFEDGFSAVIHAR